VFSLCSLSLFSLSVLSSCLFSLRVSSATTSNATQEIIENVMEKRSKVNFGPSGGKKLVCFVDDLNMPTKDEFGSQPPLELLRQWVDYHCWYDRQKQSLRYILDMQLLAAMGPPGGGRSVISQRFQSRSVVSSLLLHSRVANILFPFQCSHSKYMKH
jgi:dynein heavy chain